MSSNKSNPIFTRSEKRRAKKKVVHKIKGAARKGFARLFGIPLSPGLGGKRTSSRSTTHRSPGASSAERSPVRVDVISALRNLGYNFSQAQRMVPVEQPGESFDSLFRRATRKNPGELIIFGNPEKVYGRKNVEAAGRRGNPIPAAIIAGFEGALGSHAASVLTKSKVRSHKGRAMNAKKKQTFMPRTKKLVDDAEDLKLAQIWKESIRTGKDFPTKKSFDELEQEFQRLKKKRLLNPGSLERASELFETFHHRGSSGTYETQRSAKSRKEFTILGPLVAIGWNAEKYCEYKRALGKRDWEKYKVEHWDKLPHLAFLTGPQIEHLKRVIEDPRQYVKDCPLLGSSPNGKQLYAITPDGADVPLGEFHTDTSKDFIDLGEATFVVYLAKKPDEAVEWIHELGEEGGSRPRLVLNRLGKKELFFVGGSYRVEGPGIIN